MKRFGLVLCLALLVPAGASAKKKKAPEVQPPTVTTYGSSLDSLVRRAPGSYGRAASSDVDGDPNVGPGETVVLANIAGPAVIDRLWIAVEGGETWWRDLVLTITWDGAASPSVSAPLGDFFGIGPGARQNLQSMPIAVQSQGRSMTSFWKMAFAQSARIAIVNEGASATRQLRWEVQYRTLDAMPPDGLYFHAQYTQANPPEEGKPLTVLRASGKGQFVGMTMSSQNEEPGAWGTGSVHFEVDGATDRGPGASTLLNYFGNIFGVNKTHGPYQGCTLDEGDRVKARSSVYRFHVEDPVPFDSSIEVKVDHGVDNMRKDRLAAVTYWYQDAPQVPFEKMAAARERRWTPPTDEELALWARADELNDSVLDAYRCDDYDTALTLLEELIELEPDSVYASYNLACLYALKGEQDKALHMLETAIELGFEELAFARHDPDLTSLREHERFRKLVGLTESK
ncbi:MAG: DUF2961 domain-containing protein [Proteobacteria bacterium]|nr:DUF2961 domain-containing protein [Pseudomonadota bacterium]